MKTRSETMAFGQGPVFDGTGWLSEWLWLACAPITGTFFAALILSATDDSPGSSPHPTILVIRRLSVITRIFNAGTDFNIAFSAQFVSSDYLEASGCVLIAS
jgi:hypothetical protein